MVAVHFPEGPQIVRLHDPEGNRRPGNSHDDHRTPIEVDQALQRMHGVSLTQRQPDNQGDGKIAERPCRRRPGRGGHDN